jgi:hypothetical protein
MKKTIFLAVLIIFVAAGFAAAQGYYAPGRNNEPGTAYRRSQDSGRRPSGRVYRDARPYFQGNPGMGGMSSISETKEISGELVVKENEFPAIKSGKEEISVMIPYNAIDALKMKTGSKVSVKGAFVPAQNWNITGEKLLKVFELEYEGKKYLVHGGSAGTRSGTMKGGRW